MLAALNVLTPIGLGGCISQERDPARWTRAGDSEQVRAPVLEAKVPRRDPVAAKCVERFPVGDPPAGSDVMAWSQCSVLLDCDPHELISQSAALCIARERGLQEGSPWTTTTRFMDWQGERWVVRTETACVASREAHGCAGGDLWHIDASSGRVASRGRWQPPVPGRPLRGWSGQPIVNAVPAIVPASGLERESILAVYWAALGSAEAASAVSFCRHVAELERVGAPPQFVARACKAVGDEWRHAALCYRLAERWGGSRPHLANKGVGRLRLVSGDLAEVVYWTVLDGCVNETLAALEMLVAREQTIDAMTRWSLAQITADETAHAKLAWAFVRWAGQVGGRPVIRAIEAGLHDAGLRRHCTGAMAAVGREDPGLAAAGYMSSGLRKWVATMGMQHVVRPAAEALLQRLRVVALARASKSPAE